MSYLQRTALAESPFAQTYNTGTWNVSTSPNTATSPNWMSASGNGHSFTGSGYIFGFVFPTSNVLGALGVGSSSAAQYTRGITIDASTSSTRIMSDDMAIGYASDTKHYQISGYSFPWPSYTADSRFNVIRMEG